MCVFGESLSSTVPLEHTTLLSAVHEVEDERFESCSTQVLGKQVCLLKSGWSWNHFNCFKVVVVPDKMAVQFHVLVSFRHYQVLHHLYGGASGMSV